MRRLPGLILVFGFLAGAAAAQSADAPATPQTVVIGLDISKSNPLVEDSAYAARVAKRLTGEIYKLPVRSRLMVRTFGAYDSSANPLKIDEVISARARPETVAEGVSALVAAMPQLVAEGKLKAQDWTYIVSFMETMSHQVDCAAGDVRFIRLYRVDDAWCRSGRRQPRRHCAGPRTVGILGEGGRFLPLHGPLRLVILPRF